MGGLCRSSYKHISEQKKIATSTMKLVMTMMMALTVMSVVLGQEQDQELFAQPEENTEVEELSGYFLNAMIIVSSLLLVCNLMGITLFPAITKGLRNLGDLIQENITILKGKTGRSVDEQTLNQLSSMVDQAVNAFTALQQ